jgi:hypothetical protein
MNVRLKYDMPFSAGVFYNDEMQINQYSLRLRMITNSTNPSHHNTAFERLKHFVYNEIDSAIFINSDQKDQAKRYVKAGLKVVTLPGDPVDQVIGIMLYHKLNAIMEGRIMIVETEISSAMGDSMIYLHSENELTKDINKPAWWSSNDLVHADANLTGVDKVVSMHQASAWRELDLAWEETSEDDAHGNTVVFADFKRTDETE